MNLNIQLHKYFGYNVFKPGQEEIIKSILSGKNVIAVLPTGGGKSLCYQLPGLISNKFSIVISPLIALMKDQVDELNKGRISAAFINSTISYHDSELILREIQSGKIKLLYLAPEKLENISFAEKIKSFSPEYLFIDEAHCISEWGHNFRPSYRKIKDFAKFVAFNNIAAFTATATPEVVDDIVKQLEINNPDIFIRGFERENLSIKVIKAANKKEELLKLLNQYKTPAIIYAASRKRTEELADFLNLYKLNAAKYHAGLANEERRHIQEYFLAGKINIIVATTAFGMGINKKNIRTIIHYNISGSIENYYQEIGRAGRDGLDANAILLYNDADKNIQKFFIENSYPDKELIVNIYNAVCNLNNVAVGSLPNHELLIDQDKISKLVNQKLTPALLDSAITTLEISGYVKRISGFNKKHSFSFNLSPQKLKNYVKSISNNNLKDVIILMLRNFGSDVFNTKIQFSLAKLSQRMELPADYLDSNLTLLNNTGIAEYYKPVNDKSLKLLQPRIKSTSLNLDSRQINKNYLNAVKKLDKIIDFARTDECRMKFIIEYFGEDKKEYECGKCDNCLNENSELENLNKEYLTELILRALNEIDSEINQKDFTNILTGKNRFNESDLYSFNSSCSNYTDDEINGVIHDLINSDYITKSKIKKHDIKISASGKRFIRTEVDDNIEDSNYEDTLELFNKLRDARKEISSKFLQPPYLICPDDTLREIADQKPVTATKFLWIKGVNQRMFNKIGNEFLEIITEHLSEKENIPNTISEIDNQDLPVNISETYSLLNKGYSLSDIASLRNLTEAVISMQIETILEFYPETSISSLFEKEELDKINEEILRGYNSIKELKKRLPDKISFSKIRVAAAKIKFS